MAITQATARSIEDTLNLSILGSAHAPTGDINQTARLDTDQGVLFIKLNSADRLKMFAAEAEGLRAIAATQTLRVPTLRGYGVADRAWLALEWLRLGRATETSQYLLGQQLAQMHRATAKAFGWHQDNTIGTTPQPNPWTGNWLRFYGQHRLQHQYELIQDKGAGGDNNWSKDMQALIDGLEYFYPDYHPTPSLLHGDLWSGNQAALDDGTPVLFDPACWYGDRESDIAMSELFGGFASSFYQGYQERWELNEGYRMRRPLHQLYHVLNHANLFGGSYLDKARQMTRQLVQQIA